MRVRVLLVGVLLAGVAVVAAAGPAAGWPRETEAERIARETVAAVRASEQARLTTSLAPMPRRQVVAGPLAGRWTTCQLPEGFNPVHASVLPDGTVLLMAGSGNNSAEFAAGHFQSYIFSPDTCSTFSLPTPGDMFCSVHAMLPNGNILVAGGTKHYDPFFGLRTSYEYDWVTRQFVRRPLMAGGGRWYPGATQLGSGDVFVLSGLNGAGALNTQPEIYRPATRTWSVTPYRLSVPTYPHMLPTAGGRLFFTGVAFGGSAVRVGFLQPLTGSFQPVSGLDTNRRDEGASFFVPFSQGRKVMVAGGAVATTAVVDLYATANPVYEAGPSLDEPRKYLSHATLFDGRVLLVGGQDPQNNPVFTAQLYRPISNRLEAVTPTSAAHQYHSNLWVDRTGRAILVGGNPARGSVQRLVERFEPWYVDLADRPQITSAPAIIGHNQPFTAHVQLAAGVTLKHLRIFRLASTPHQFGAAEGDFTLTRVATPAGAGWSLTNSPNLTPPGYYYLLLLLLLLGRGGLTRRPLTGQDHQGHLGRHAKAASGTTCAPEPSAGVAASTGPLGLTEASQEARRLDAHASRTVTAVFAAPRRPGGRHRAGSPPAPPPADSATRPTKFTSVRTMRVSTRTFPQGNGPRHHKETMVPANGHL